jgi:hypothetical protein
MQVGEVAFRARGPVERLDVGLELNEIAGHEACRQAEVAQDLHQQPSRISAGALPGRERLLDGLDSVLHPDHVANLVLQTLVELDQKIDGLARLERNAGEKRLELLAGQFRLEAGRKLGTQFGRIDEWKRLGARLDEEVERIDHLHVGDEIDRHGKFGRLLREDEAGDAVPVGIVLPVHEMLRRRHLQGIARHARAPVRGRAQPDDLRPEIDRSVVVIAGDMMEAGAD